MKLFGINISWFAGIIGFSCFFSVSHATNLPQVQHWLNSQGVPVYFIQTTNLPMLNLGIVLDAGSARDNQKAGLAQLTASLLDQGTKQHSAKQIALGFDSLGAIFNADVSTDFAVIQMQCLTRNDVLTPALEMFHEVLTEPSFSNNSLEKQKILQIQEVKGNSQDPNEVANRLFFSNVYSNSYYASPIFGTLNSIPSLNLNSVENFYKKYYVLKNISIIMAGTISSEQAKNIANHLLTGLPQGNIPTKLTNLNPAPKKTIEKNFPANQSSIRIGTQGISFSDPDYFSLMVGNEILGGGFSSRLFQTVREKYGLSYGVNSYIMPLKMGGPFLIALQTRAQKTQEAIQLSKNLMKNFIQNGPTSAELQLAKQFYAGNFPLRLQTHNDLMGYLITIAFYHRPLNFLQTYLNRINELTPNEIHQAFLRHFQTKNWVTIVVGPHDQKIPSSPK